ncbi:hypothetical protein ACUY3M_06730 [Corynebacterium suicordis]|uniref:Secreted protein n=1 Tax=Corynebacterium suicordis DSM 45110 TaxID=1121369 RepID=A0ABR9ZK52_9CORY|nr:hypothetical protein [Corynebacterium suicordis]MBF4553770.1 hypothetical protein [Corynebacterium suicordis DSM 45110]MDR6277253.1 guanyl-specific ribonuclease Sa [Corynebacterium suicordis]
MTQRKTLLAAVMVVPLFLAACGSDDEGSTETSASSNASTSASQSEGKETKPAESTSASASGNPSEANPEADAAAAEQQNAAEEALAQPHEPRVPAGGTASGDDTKAISDLTFGLAAGGNNVGTFLTYTVDNSCSEYKNRYGGDAKLRQEAETAKELTFDQIGGTAPSISDVQNVRVNGDQATADVTSNEGAQSLNYVREGGKWTFCN